LSEDLETKAGLEPNDLNGAKRVNDWNEPLPVMNGSANNGTIGTIETLEPTDFEYAVRR
jgi:hypothetical protein